MKTSLERSTILVVHDDPDERALLSGMLERGGFETESACDGKEALEAVCARPPLCVVAGKNIPSVPDEAILADLRAANLYGHLPIIIVASPDELTGINWHYLPADDFVLIPVDERELVSRVRLSSARIQRDIHANPLTGLPGNPTIMLDAERRIRAGQPFALAHADLDAFKPFNDRYGFARGDEVIRMTARLLVNTVKELDSSDTHVGHIGGDDFVFILPAELAETACKQFLRDFDQIVVNFYDATDVERGAIDSVNRKGESQTFPVMTCSIGVVDTAIAPVQHLGELCARVAEVKSCAKKMPGSAYLIDRRSR